MRTSASFRWDWSDDAPLENCSQLFGGVAFSHPVVRFVQCRHNPEIESAV